MKVATFLSIIGYDGMTRYNSYKIEYADDIKELDTLINVFDKDFTQKTNLLHERY